MSVLIVILALILIGLLAGLIYLLTLPKSFKIEEKLFMEVSPKKVYSKVLDFPTWAEWSPWLMHEPDAKLSFSDEPTKEGGYYSWEGKSIGAGVLKHEAVKQDKFIKQSLTFTRPYKSQAMTQWHFKATNKKIKGKKLAGTEVTWRMESSIFLLLRWMIPFIQSSVSRDYKMGLLLLAAKLSPKADKLSFDFTGTTQTENINALAEPISGKLSDLPKNSSQAMMKLEERMKSEKLTMDSPPFNAYWKMNMKKQTTVADSAYPIKEKDAAASKVFPGGKYLKIVYQGDYKHLAQAWGVAMNHVRMHKHKMNKSLPSMEVYVTDPRKTPSPNDYKTELLIPVK